LPQSVIDTERRAGLVKTKKVPELAVKYPVNIVFRKDKKLSNSSLAFLEILRKESAHPPALDHPSSKHK